jgi:hypothetical protein
MRPTIVPKPAKGTPLKIQKIAKIKVDANEIALRLIPKYEILNKGFEV